eukprot:GEZU01024800.1.p1 GENE.GEZU01024800.1~~GEZU01024800.1.p1  ORF type:complete len:223 (+),score=88.74 GEZU01024800.1:107-775(+)
MRTQTALNQGKPDVFNLPEQPTLLFEFNGTKLQVEEQTDAVKRITQQKHHGSNFKFAFEEKARKELWKARGEAFWAAQALRPGADVWTTDVCVPISKLAQCITETKEDIAKFGLPAPLVGHVGDGNFHLFILLDYNNPDELRRAQELNKRLVNRAISMDGTCTGEHGVGVGKKPYLIQEKGVEAIRLMQTIKSAIDPNNIMNPGKVIPDLDENGNPVDDHNH